MAFSIFILVDSVGRRNAAHSANDVVLEKGRTTDKIDSDSMESITSTDHGSKGNSSDVPPWAWPASLALAAFFLFGAQILGWLLRVAL